MATPPTPYLKLGRGGAGNYLFPTPQTHQDPTTTHSSLSSPANDIESQTPTQPVLAAAKGEQAAQAEYAHSGRGGAGNWFSPRELTATGTFATTASTPTSSPISIVNPTITSGSASTVPATASTKADGATSFAPAPAPAPASSLPVAGPTYYGRGGAGNFNARSGSGGVGVGAGREEEEERESERERRREEIGEMARREVERGLRRPEGAYLRGLRVEDV